MNLIVLMGKREVVLYVAGSLYLYVNHIKGVTE